MTQNAVHRFSPAPSQGTGTSRTKNVLRRFPTVAEAVAALRPAQPLHCLHPDALAQNAATFLQNFPGITHYAVKANPDLYVLKYLHAAGVRHFEVASLAEVKLIRSLSSEVSIAFMHPVKGREVIRAAYTDYGVRTFALDTADELQKILEETGNASDLTLIVRLARPAGTAACPLADKFGATEAETETLLRAASAVAVKTGISFHVGSQTLDPQSYADAIRVAGAAVAKSGVKLDVFDVGGGFPVVGMGMEVPSLAAFFDVIRAEVAALALPATCEVWCEPGRALAATAETLVVRVELRKGDLLYINDGFFGSMSEVRMSEWRNDVVRLGRENAADVSLQAFRLYGPTCDSVDYMPGPFMLPADIAEGDWVALSSMGAYMAASQSHFNGFYSDLQVEIKSSPAKLVRLRSSQREKGGKL